jgi:N-acetylmuramic acid 6-phosphate etherase
MITENSSARFLDLDAWPTEDAVQAMYEGQLAAMAAVRPALAAIALAADAASLTLQADGTGRLIFVGAGTSGRVAIQDGAELPPTFNWPPARLVYVMAGGMAALVNSVEGAEDDAVDAVQQMDRIGVNPADVVIGLAASGMTPFTVAALRQATTLGAVTIGIANNPDTPLLEVVHFPILLETGVEVVAGSTRMKAGTSQKVALNLLSTAIMIRLGRIYRGMMVHMRPTNIKLRRRAELMVARIADCDRGAAANALKQADGDIKLAAMIAMGVDPAIAEDLLARHSGNLRAALAAVPLR